MTNDCALVACNSVRRDAGHPSAAGGEQGVGEGVYCCHLSRLYREFWVQGQHACQEQREYQVQPILFHPKRENCVRECFRCGTVVSDCTAVVRRQRSPLTRHFGQFTHTRNATECVAERNGAAPSDGTGSLGRCTAHLMAKRTYVPESACKCAHAPCGRPVWQCKGFHKALGHWTRFRAQRRCTAIACSQRRLTTCRRTGREAQRAQMVAREGRRPGVWRPQEPGRNTC